MHVNVSMYGCVTGQVGGRALRRRARTLCPLPQVSVFVMICVAVCWPTSAISSALPAATVTDAMQNGTLEYGGSGLYNDTVTGNLSMSYPDNTTSDDITTDTTTSTITTGVGTGDDEGSLAKRIIKEPLFIGLCVGVGALIPITAITLVIANRQHKKRMAKRKSKHIRNKELEASRKSSALHELLGYDPLPDGRELSPEDLTVWVAASDQLKLPHIAVNGVSRIPVTSHARITKQGSHVSMNARLFVKDWGEEFPEDALSTGHSNIVLNPVFEDTVAKPAGEGERNPLQRRTSQLSLMRQALTPNTPAEEGIEWTQT
ncbi:uncharacterized protein LOC135809233 [Sycon ciliatum]|uniref:uncharacterized protein LOC135809233 n=1 Tax=Sycon ciliatum TaxID=27933 RepID=UPI0031F6537A